MPKKRVLEVNKVYLGYFNGEPIWREKTAEERLGRIKKELANLYIALNENGLNQK